MEFLQVNGLNKDFFDLCKKLESFQHNLLPILKDKGYSLTDNLQDITGYILYIDKKPVGSIGIKKISDKVCEIVRVFVCEEYRGKGYATFLFEKVESLAKSLGFRKAEMVAWCKAVPALMLYQKLGFTKSEEKISEWYGNLEYVELFKFL